MNSFCVNLSGSHQTRACDALLRTTEALGLLPITGIQGEERNYPWLKVLKITLSYPGLLLMRAYAISHRHRIVLWVLAPLLLGCVITAAVSNVRDLGIVGTSMTTHCRLWLVRTGVASATNQNWTWETCECSAQTVPTVPRLPEPFRRGNMPQLQTSKLFLRSY